MTSALTSNIDKTTNPQNFEEQADIQRIKLNPLHTLAMRCWLCIGNPENAAQSGDKTKTPCTHAMLNSPT